jgi:hypothetical protein
VARERFYAAGQATVRCQTSANLCRVAHFPSCTSLHSLPSQIEREITRRSVTMSRPRVGDQRLITQEIVRERSRKHERGQLRESGAMTDGRLQRALLGIVVARE